MKKLLLVGALALFGAINAQTKFGLKAGYSLSTISEKYKNEKEKNDGKSSFYVGGLVEYKLNSKWALQGEVLYTQLGAKNEDAVPVSLGDQVINVKVKTDINLSTILIPVGAKFFVDPSFSINGGVAFGFYVNRDINVDVIGYNSMFLGGKSYVQTFNMAPYLGLEYNLDNGLFFDTRYNFGLTNINMLKVDGYKMTNSFLQIGLGYKF